MAKIIPATGFTVGWVCALPIELAAATEMMDEEYGNLPQPPNDTNNYTFGRVGVHNVVAACLPAGQMGTNQAAVVASQMRTSFPSLRFGILVGIGGGVPSDKNDIRLGDVVISQPVGQLGGVVQFDFGKTGPDGRILRTGSLNAPPIILLNALTRLSANELRGKARISEHLTKLSALPIFSRPDTKHDRLYAASTPHVTGLTCDNCSLANGRLRQARPTSKPYLFVGNIASGNQVMKDGPTRDRISRDLGGVLCFEMEAAGLMNNFPCLVLRGICDYADAHKNKQWQPYAAATAAAYAKELLLAIPQVISTQQLGQDSSELEACFMVPLGRNNDFVGRETVLEQLWEIVLPDSNADDCQRIAVEGLGGVGKTQVALETAYRIRQRCPTCSVFWVPAINKTSFENGYREIGQALKLPGITEDKADIKALVKTALSQSPTEWLLIIDNADETDLLFGTTEGPSLYEYLPFSRKGSLLFTTRNHEVAVRLDISPNHLFRVSEMSETEANLMLRKTLTETQTRDSESMKSLLDFLAYLPLAIKQASAYIRQTGISVTKYLEYCRHSDSAQIKVLSRDFNDRSRYPEVANSIATTWLISFAHIAQKYPLAARYLKFICFLAEKDIPKSLLPVSGGEIEKNEAIGALKGYAFIIEREGFDSFDIHRLVRLVTRNWIKSEWRIYCTKVIQYFAQIYPYPEHKNRQIWTKYLPHAETVLEIQEHCTDQKARARLLFVVANSYDEFAKYKKAERMYRQALDLYKLVLGSKHSSTISCMNNLAIVLAEQGKYEEAGQMHRAKLQLCKTVFGPDNPSTLDSMNNLAIVLGKQGKYKEAEQMHRTKLQLCKTVLGPDNMSTLQSMNNLAVVLSNQGKHGEAEQMHRQVIQLCKTALGPDNPSTLKSMNNLANVVHNQGKHEEAEQMHRQGLQLFKTVLGPDDPSTLKSMNNLAIVLGKQGKYKEAEQMHRQVLQLCKTALGPDNPSTLKSMNNLANVVHNQGQHEEAEQICRQRLELMQEIHFKSVSAKTKPSKWKKWPRRLFHRSR